MGFLFGVEFQVPHGATSPSGKRGEVLIVGA